MIKILEEHSEDSFLVYVLKGDPQSIFRNGKTEEENFGIERDDGSIIVL